MEPVNPTPPQTGQGPPEYGCPLAEAMELTLKTGAIRSEVNLALEF